MPFDLNPKLYAKKEPTPYKPRQIKVSKEQIDLDKAIKLAEDKARFEEECMKELPF